MKGRRLLRWAEHVLAGLGTFFLFYFAGFDLSYMASGSMEPTLAADPDRPDWVLTERVSRWFAAPRRWEVITFRDSYGTQLMKRVVGLPGEAVSLPEVGRLHIDGRPLEIPIHLASMRHLPAGNLAEGRSASAGEGWYVLGDEVRDSLDSRFEGPVPRKRIVGSAWLRVWPPSRWGRIR